MNYAVKLTEEYSICTSSYEQQVLHTYSVDTPRGPRTLQITSRHKFSLCRSLRLQKYKMTCKSHSFSSAVQMYCDLNCKKHHIHFPLVPAVFLKVFSA